MSPRDRFFVEGSHAPGERIAFADDDARKIALVLRKRTGEAVVVVDSAARSWQAELTVADGAVSAVLIEALAGSAVEPSVEITLAQGIPKGQKMDFVVEKATELGVARIVPLRTSRSIPDAGPNKVERWRKLARAAAQQSGRTRVPEVREALDFAALIGTFADYDAVLLPWELATASLREALVPLSDARSLLVPIGPEGGLSQDEAEAASAAGARLVSLGARILRTETAPLVALTAILYERGEL